MKIRMIELSGLSPSLRLSARLAGETKLRLVCAVVDSQLT